jgi:hypothetical protein
MPQARGGTGRAAWLNGEFWIIGGDALDGPGASAQGTYARVDIYDPAARSWRRGPDLPTARHGVFPVVDAGRILVAGGGAGATGSRSDVLELIWPRN